jgi:hypothetical protein
MMNRTRSIRFLLAAGILAGTGSLRAEHAASVVGLVNLTNYQAALLVITDSPPDASFATSTHIWVTEGQRFDDLSLMNGHGQIEIRQIDFTNGVVQAKDGGVDTLYLPQPTNLMGTAAGTGIHLNNVRFDDALDFYAFTKGRTLLVHPDLKGPSLTISADARTKAEAAGIMEKNLRGKGVAMVADGDRFEWMVPAEATNNVPPAALPARLSAKGPTTTNAVDALPAGSINFQNVDLPQALEVYKALTAQKWVQDKPLPFTVTLNFHNQTPLTKYETLHALDVLLAWHGLKIVSVDDKSFKLVPVAAGK